MKERYIFISYTQSSKLCNLPSCTYTIQCAFLAPTLCCSFQQKIQCSTYVHRILQHETYKLQVEMSGIYFTVHAGLYLQGSITPTQMAELFECTCISTCNRFSLFRKKIARGCKWNIRTSQYDRDMLRFKCLKHSKIYITY